MPLRETFNMGDGARAGNHGSLEARKDRIVARWTGWPLGAAVPRKGLVGITTNCVGAPHAGGPPIRRLGM